MKLFALKRFISRPPAKQEREAFLLDKDLLSHHTDTSIADSLPFPLWIRDSTLNIRYRNQAYKTLLNDYSSDILNEIAKPLAEEAQQANRPIRKSKSIGTDSDGKYMLLIETTSPSLEKGVTMGMAIELIETILSPERGEYYDKATAIYGSDMLLTYYNAAFANLWQLESEFLDSKPSYIEVLHRLRDSRHLPEQADFQKFKQRRMSLFKELTSPFQDNLYLPDGRTIAMDITRHSNGGLMFAFEDITERLAYERSYNMLSEVQQTVLKHLHEGVAVFGQNGKLTYYNPSYAYLWGLDSHFLDTTPHVNELLEAVKSLYVTNNWDRFKADFISILAERTPRRACIERTDGMVVERIFVPLPDGSTMVSYLDITDLAQRRKQVLDNNSVVVKVPVLD